MLFLVCYLMRSDDGRGGEVVVATVQQMFSYWANSDLLPVNYDFVWQLVFSLDDGTGDRRS